jgi:hypothetical protein
MKPTAESGSADIYLMSPVRMFMNQGAALLPRSFNSAVEYAFQKVQVNQDGLKLNGIHQLLVYADDVNTMGGNIYMTKKNKETLLLDSRQTSLELNTEKTAYAHVL